MNLPAASRAAPVRRPLVALMTTLSRNVGDDFIREGIRWVLSTALGAHEVAYINKHEPETLQRTQADETRRYTDKFWQADLVVQCGAPVFWHLAPDATPLQAEWYEWLWRDRILSARADRPPFVNLGAGSCSRWGDDGSTYLSDPACCRFAEAASQAALLTTLRDPVAEAIFRGLNLPAESLPCPGFLAAGRHGRRVQRLRRPLVAVNLMPRGGHFNADSLFDEAAWQAFNELLLQRLRALADVVFVAHDEAEAQYMAGLAQADELVVAPADWRDFIELYSRLHLWIGNRVHGAVCASGVGVPSMVFGTDTRTEIGRWIGIELQRSAAPSLLQVEAWLERHLGSPAALADETERLLAQRAATHDRYVTLLGPALQLVGLRD